MNPVVRGLRTAYWVGAIVDAAAGVQMLSPRLFATMMGLGDFRPGPDFSYATGMGAALMFGWTALLLWADRAPIERRSVLLLTLFRSSPASSSMKSPRSVQASCRSSRSRRSGPCNSPSPSFS